MGPRGPPGPPGKPGDDVSIPEQSYEQLSLCKGVRWCVLGGDCRGPGGDI